MNVEHIPMNMADIAQFAKPPFPVFSVFSFDVHFSEYLLRKNKDMRQPKQIPAVITAIIVTR